MGYEAMPLMLWEPSQVTLRPSAKDGKLRVPGASHGGESAGIVQRGGLKVEILTAWWFQIFWKILVNWDDDIPNLWENKSHVPVTTNQLRYGHDKLNNTEPTLWEWRTVCYWTWPYDLWENSCHNPSQAFQMDQAEVGFQSHALARAASGLLWPIYNVTMIYQYYTI